MDQHRICKHPILPIPPSEKIEFYWQGDRLAARRGETIASALFANGVRIFGHHIKDGSPQGIFCANGQCAQCLVLADGKPVKSCMELVRPGVMVEPVDGAPELPLVERVPAMTAIETVQLPVLIIGGGPAGLSAAIELGQLGIETLIVDDKHRLGGKLVLQTHRFFGSSDAVYAGTRGIDIATKLEKRVREYESVQVWLNSTVLAVYSDRKVGVLRDGERYVLVEPQVMLVAAGAREKSLVFRGNTLPGVYGAGAFQTLVNRDLVRPAERLFIVGGGNVGLIAGYHALQAGIQVVGLVEALPECGGYKVHRDKLVRMGVPIYTGHTVISANGPPGMEGSRKETVDSITICRVDADFKPVPGSERSFQCDTILIAVGLDPVNEFLIKAREFGLPALAAGDAEEIAEASAAMFNGKIKGREIVSMLDYPASDVPEEWRRMVEILKSKPGRTVEENPTTPAEIFPVFHCLQEIPCDPCTTACPQGLIVIDKDDIRGLPAYISGEKSCIGCEKCVTLCPGLAITLMDCRKDQENPTVTIPYEFLKEQVKVGDRVTALDVTGNELGEFEVVGVKAIKTFDRTIAVRVQAPAGIAEKISGIRVQEIDVTLPLEQAIDRLCDDVIVCRCERVTAGEIRALIRQGYRDLNEIKVMSRAGMGSCGGKTCTPLIHRLFREESVDSGQVIDQTHRPLFIEAPIGVFAGVVENQE